MSNLSYDSEDENHPLDLNVAKVLGDFAQTTSRRGMLAVAGRTLLKILGISLLPLLPVDRIFAQNQNCSDDWQYCWQWGAFCAACCGSSKPYILSCPKCLYAGSSWSHCCCAPSCPSGKGYTVSYTDCCGLVPGYTQQAANACEGAWCKRAGVGQPYWCGSEFNSATYRCTFTHVDTSTMCSPCSS
jgi:hypothetical protein